MSEPYWYGLLLIGGIFLIFTAVILVLTPTVRPKDDYSGFSSHWYADYIGLFSICVFFYLAWGFGLPSSQPLYLGAARIIFQVVFIISNCVLGLLMVLSYCLLSRALYCQRSKGGSHSFEARVPPASDPNIYSMEETKTNEGIHFENMACAVDDGESPPPDYESLPGADGKADLGRRESVGITVIVDDSAIIGDSEL